MNESILKALLRLFAIVADVSENAQSDNERSIVMDYLDRQYSEEVVQKYIEYFDQQVLKLHPDRLFASDLEALNHSTSGDISITGLCNQINEELDQEQRLIILVYLLDFIGSSSQISEKKVYTVEEISAAMKISDDEFKDIRAFTFGSLKQMRNKDRLLFIDANEPPANSGIKHMPAPKMDGRIGVLNIPTTNTYVFRYNGKLDLVLNGHIIKPDRSYIWSAGSVIKNSRIGSLYFSRMAGRFIQANLESKFVFTADDIEFSYRNSSNGLKRFSFTEESGRLIGIIGGSGSGKSTLLNVLNGNIRPKHGHVRINGYDIHENNELLKGIIGFVPQDDLLIKELTVFQNLFFNARLCFNNYSEAQINKLVEKALIDFDLVEARDLYVGDAITTILSGGQRKRLNIALELIREPSILLVDEPTSGLSSADSEKIVILLKRQALKGNLVIANIHQPSSDVFKMLDKLLVMDQGGRVIFYGNPVNAITYFKRASHYADAEESECLSCGNINADQILRIVESRVVDVNGKLTRKRKTSPEEWYKRYLNEIDVKVRMTQREHDHSIPPTNFGIPDHLKQFKIFFKRDVLAKFHNKQYLFISAVEAPLLAFILAFFTKNFIFVDGLPKYIFGENSNLPGFLFMAVIVSLFLGLVNSAEEIFKDRKILKREKFLNLSRSSYLFSKISILFIISAIQSIIFVLITNGMLGIRGMVFDYWLILFTTSCWANMIGLNISSGLNSAVTIYILVPIILVPELLFSGVVVPFDKMHYKIASEKNVPFIGDLMTSRWAYEALMVTQFKDNHFEKQFYNSEKEISNSTYYKSYAIPYLQNLITDCDQFTLSRGDTTEFSNDLAIIRNEVRKIANDLELTIPPSLNNLTLHRYASPAGVAVNNFLNQAESQYVSRYNQAVKVRDGKFAQLAKKLGGDNAFLKYKNKYYNKRLASVVTNENEIKEFVIQNHEMLPIQDAVFRMPDFNDGRAHFYAPFKRVLGLNIDTFWFNMLFVWFFSAFLLVLLYYDVLRKILAYFETIRLNRLTRRRFLRLLVQEQADTWKSAKRK